MNFVFISPNFPPIYSHFVKALKERGMTVLGIGDCQYNDLNDELKANLTEYCFVSDLSNKDWMKATLDYLQNKYGHLDYLESNNEYWLESDAYLREYAGITTGQWPKDMEKIKFKSKMKAYFEKAGAKVARYHLVSSLEESIKFVDLVGYPVFAKPDNGVGAAETYKIDNYDELVNFHNTKPNEQYIMEEFISGYISSFDGICDEDSNVVLAFNETFPTPIAEVVINDSDVYYYANTKMKQEFFELGKRVVKAFNIKKRCFHIEFFVLNKARKGLGKKGDIIALETNMRSPGGDTPDLLCIALNDSYYDCYADVIAYNKSNLDPNKERFISISANRKYRNNYIHTKEEIYQKYQKNIVKEGYYPPAIARAMGDYFFLAKFKTKKETLEFADFVLAK